MEENHLQVPGQSSPPPNDASNASIGRPRSGSQRSQHSQRSAPQSLPPTTETPDFSRRPSIRIRRAPSFSREGENAPIPVITEGQHVGGRSRSNSAPAQPGGGSQRRTGSYMPDLTEERMNPATGHLQDGIAELAGDGEGEVQSQSSPRGWRTLRKARTNIGREGEGGRSEESEYESELVDILDLVDPEVSTLQTLTNVQNSLVIPHIPYMGRWIDRRPTYTLTRRPVDIQDSEGSDADTSGAEKERPKGERRPTGVQRTHTGTTINTISSRVNDRFYAVLPHGVSLPGWSEEEKLELNDHVRHMLHSRRSKFRRGMKGFGQYVRKPLGLFVTVYATLITLFGLIWVLFLIGWINVGGRHDYIINVIDNVLVALFAIIGDGLAPFRAVDTYHMCFIAHYHHLTWRLRREKALPKLTDNNDLPAIQPPTTSDIEKQEFSVLSPEQQRKLAHHQKKFARSHSFYKPHETATHRAFPLRLLVAVVVLLDCHSLLQIALGTCTWSISYHVRPFALTTVILCCSITCNITAGILISIGDHKTRKKDVLEKMFRQELTKEAMKKVERKRGSGLSPSESGNQTEEHMWEAVDEQVFDVDRAGQNTLEPMAEGEESDFYPSPNETPLSPGSDRPSYMPIQSGNESLPRIITTTTSNSIPGGMTTTTSTHFG